VSRFYTELYEFKGLRSSLSEVYNGMGLSQSLGMKPRGERLIPTNKPTDPLAAPLTMEWPFPQLFLTNNNRLVVDKTALYTANSSWVRTAVSTKDVDSTNTAKAISAGGVWHLVDMFNSYILLNGNNVVFKGNFNGMFGLTDNVYVDTTITIQTGCNHNGRVLLGGFETSNAWKNAWRSFWSDRSNSDVTGIDDSVGIGQNYVWWSSIGGGDVFSLIYPHKSIDGNIHQSSHGDDLPLVFEYLKRNECGYMPMPWPGKVLSLKPLGKHVIAYCEEGVAALTLVSSPIPTYGLTKLLDIGAYDRGSVSGDTRGHIMLGEDGALWQIGADLKVNRLRYDEFTASMRGNTVCCTFDPSESEYYISDDTKSYVLTQSGLGEANFAPTSLIYEGNNFRGLYEIRGGNTFTISTGIKDMNLPSIKQIGSVWLSGHDLGDVTVNVRAKYSQGTSWYDSGWKEVGPEGSVWMGISGIAFEIQVRGNPGSNAVVRNVRVEWQVTDNRYVRGPLQEVR